IVGVLPPGFRFLSSPSRLYFPLASSPEQRAPERRHWGDQAEMIARLAPDVTVAAAQEQVDAQNTALEKTNPRGKAMADAGFRSMVVPLHRSHVAAVRPTLLLIQVGVLFLLLIGIVNLVNLLLIRASARLRELAIRQAMGASRRHVASSVMVETSVLTAMGAALGLAVGAVGIRLLLALGADRLPLGAQIAFDGRLALVALAAAFALGVAIATPIAWYNLRTNVSTALYTESRSGTLSRAAQRLRHGFVVAQIALAFVVLADAGLLALSLKQVMAVSPGFRTDHVSSGRISPPYSRYPNDKVRLDLIDRMLEAIHRQPGVITAGVTSNVPLSGNTVKSAATVKGYSPPAGVPPHGHYSYSVTGDYFGAAGIPLREGRLFTPDDARRPERVCIVDEDFARRYWPGRTAIGQRLFMGASQDTDDKAFTVVGVVGAVKQAGLADQEQQGAVYYTFRYRGADEMFLVARTALPPDEFAATLRRIVRQIDPELPLSDVQSMDTRVAESLVTRRSPAVLAGLFAAVALLLTAIGTYGVLSYAVAQRRREIGLRIALGARPDQVRAQFVGLGLRLLAAGGTLGLAAAWLTGRAMQTMLFRVPPLPWAILVGTTVIMLVVSLAASLWPSYRATRISPMQALNDQ
ncbi:MAG TPA: FtsX-like permease family protein, partial [Vicinamibacterales bacterium]